MQDIPPQGSITDIFFPRLMARLQRDGFEGAVRVSVGETTKILYFKGGEIASAASNAESDRLASILIEEGRLTTPQLDMAKSRLPDGGSLGRTLIEMGFLTPAELLQGARRQVRQILVSCCTLSSGSYQVEPGALRSEVTVLGLPTRRLIFETILEAPDRLWIVREVGSMEATYRPTNDLLPELNALKLDAAVDQLARALDRDRTLRDLSGGTSLDDFLVSKVVLALEVLGLAERVEGENPPSPMAPEGRDIRIDVEEAPPPPEEEILELADLDGAPIHPDAGGPPDVKTEDDAPAYPATAPQEAEPPPFSPDELPAFATPSAPAGAEWQVDARTGERVHLGPIEITFEGQIAPRTEDRSSLRAVLVAATTITLLIAGVILYLGRREGAPGDGEDSLRSATEAKPTPGGEPAPVVEPSPAGVATPAPSPSAPPPTPAPTLTPAPTIPALTQTFTGSSPFEDAGGYQEALRHLDVGDPAGAARLFEPLVAGVDPGRFTLQILVACETETLRTARSQSGASVRLFVLPLALKDRSCYRVCWGIYRSKDEAGAAIETLPTSLGRAGGKPIVLSVGRLRRSP